MRKYERSWNILKDKKVILAQVTTSEDKRVLLKHASTFIRGVQKEKYQDVIFRRRYPDAVVVSTINYETKQVRVELVLNSYKSVLEEL